MLNPQNDRLDYGQLLAPPPEYSLDFAIGTTYSLDLDALVGISLALGLSEETDSRLMNNPVCLLEALRATGDRLALFCEGGQIHLPNSVTPLYILLERTVFQVNTSKHRGIAKYPSFHPKFWLVRYIKGSGEVLYRTVVLSRNLTFDNSWDVAFCMNGTMSKDAMKKNDPVCDFLSFLISHLPDDDNGKAKGRKIKAIMRELPRVRFSADSKEFSDFEFLPVGIANSKGGYHSTEDDGFLPLFEETYNELLIMSPFLSSSVVRDFNHRAHNSGKKCNMLFTRAMSLGKLNASDCSSFRIFTMKDAVIDGEAILSEEDIVVRKQDIHAKIYMVRKNSDSYLYLGSLNASHNAVSGNVEFILLLKSKNRYLNLEKLSRAFFNGDEGEPSNPFQEASITNVATEDNDEKQNALEGVIKDIARMNPTASARANGELFDLSVCFRDIYKSEYEIVLSPLLSNKKAKLERDILFSSLSLTQLSEFFKISVSDEERTVERVIIIPTANLPDDREKAVVSSIINDKNCFYRYVAFLIGEISVLGALEMENNGESYSKGSHISPAESSPALYEKMLQTAATSPKRFEEIEYLLKAVSKDGGVPEHFEELFDSFKRAVK